MRIKSYITALLISAMGMGLNSCLDLEPMANMGDDKVWNTPENFQLFANQFYGWTRDFQRGDNSYANGYVDGPHSDFRSDLVASASQNEYSQGTNTIPNSDGNYTTLYTRIYYTNLLLDNARNFGDQQAISVPVAEAKFFRAYLYFELVQLYGDVILVTSPVELDDPAMQQSRNDRSEVIDQIITDLKEAAEGGLPETAPKAGLVTKGAAYALLSRVALYEGTWQKFHTNGADASPSDNTIRSKELLTVARDAASVVMGLGYELFSNSTLGTDSYRYMFILEDETCNPAGVTKSGNTEYILAARHRIGDRLNVNLTHSAFGNAVEYTRKFANMYLCSNGLPIENTASQELFKGYTNPQDEFQNRDNRMAGSFLVYGNTYWNNDDAPRQTWDNKDLANGILANVSRICKGSGYQNYKWAVERKVDDYYEAPDYPVIRYAEVLLNYAEAVYELGATDDVLDQALNESLNKVRARSNPKMPSLTSDFVNRNRLDMRQEIRRERTVELILEGFRLDDLKRWKTAEKEMPMDQEGVKYTGTWFEINWPKLTNTVNADGNIVLFSGRTWAEKNYLYPLPSDQIQLNPNIGQNPYWGK